MCQCSAISRALRWDSHTRTVHPSPIYPFLQVFTACNGKAGFHSKILGKYSKKALPLFLTLCDQVFCKLQAVLGTIPSTPAPNSHGSIFYVAVVADEGKKHQLDSTSMRRLIIRLDFQPDSSTLGKILALMFKILLTVLHFN